MLRNQAFEDPEPSPDLPVLALNLLHPPPGLIQFQDALFHIPNICLATVAECPLCSPILGRATWVRDVARWYWHWGCGETSSSNMSGGGGGVHDHHGLQEGWMLLVEWSGSEHGGGGMHGGGDRSHGH